MVSYGNYLNNPENERSKLMRKREYLHCPFCGSWLLVKTEEGRERKYCDSCHWTYYPQMDVAVGGMAVRVNREDRDGPFQVLIVRRNREPSKDAWSFPAGFVNYGEHPETALVREMKEETDLTVVRFNLVRMAISDDDTRSPHQLAFYYKVKVTGKIQNKDPEENSEIKWLDLDPTANIEFAWNNHRLLFEAACKEPSLFVVL